MGTLRNKLLLMVWDNMPSWMVTAHKTYGIPYANLMKAYAMLPEMQWCFKDGKQCYMYGDGASWIDTGLKPTNNTEIEMVYRSLENSNSGTYYGCGTSFSSSDAFEMYNYTGHEINYRGSYGFVFKYFGYKTKYTFKNGSYTFENSNGNSEKGTINAGTYSSTRTLYVLGTNRPTALGSTANARMSMFIIDNVDKKLILIPSNQDGAYGMFDLVEGKFYANQGTGSFSIEVIDD